MKKLHWFAMLLLPLTALATAPKIGVVSLERIVRDAPQTTEIKAHLKQQFQEREQAIVTDNKSLNTEVQALDRDRSILPSNEVKAAEEKVNRHRRDLAYKQQSFREDFMRAQNNEMGHLLKQVRKQVRIIAKHAHFDIILQEESLPYVSQQLDITDKVIAALKKQS